MRRMKVGVIHLSAMEQRSKSIHFQGHPGGWQRYKDEVAGVNKRAGEDRNNVKAVFLYSIELIEFRVILYLDSGASFCFCLI